VRPFIAFVIFLAGIAGAGFAILFKLKKNGMTRAMTNLG
jgi:formate-dependent nitrite reductase membrane component NrfD